MKPSCVPVAASAVFRLAMSAASVACPTYLIGPVQAGRATGRRAALGFCERSVLGPRLPIHPPLDVDAICFGRAGAFSDPTRLIRSGSQTSWQSKARRLLAVV